MHSARVSDASECRVPAEACLRAFQNPGNCATATVESRRFARPTGPQPNSGIPIDSRSTQHKRFEAEERFKQIQVAYRELVEHCESPANCRRAKPTSAFKAGRSAEEARAATPFISAAHQVALPHRISLTTLRKAFTAAHLEDTESALGIYRSVRRGSERGKLSQYILLTQLPDVFVRDASGILSIVWYTDLGEISLIDPGASKEAGYLAKNCRDHAGHAATVFAAHQSAAMETAFACIDGRSADDRVKKVIYNFLRQMKSKQQS